ncbi:MAG TPA: L-histidine N(alpha)-methyltransferase [Thiobacillaceae bacterium]|nr:L-histidine N(alpha)-methyltransferase [Thiobacillaceae bacterium]
MNLPPANLHFSDLQPSAEDFRSAVMDGLGCSPKRLPPKFFYDEQGSRLFDAITELPEYYPTRTEIGLLRRHGQEIAERLGSRLLLIELGSGSDVKIRVLLNALHPSAYMPIDISAQHLYRSGSAIAEDFPELQVHAVCADYSGPLRLPEVAPNSPRAAFFPGSSIGNFEPAQAAALLERIRGMVGQGGRLLIGVDLKKDAGLLDVAYNDAQGVTAAFNRNLLVRINRELDADFDLEAFDHRAFYNAEKGRVEMHLIARSPQRVYIDGHYFDFRAGEGLHTENSYKYNVAEFRALAEQAGYVSEKVWQDEQNLFSLHCLRVA